MFKQQLVTCFISWWYAQCKSVNIYSVDDFGVFFKDNYNNFLQNVDCPMIVPTEYQSSSFLKDPEELGNLEHPVSGSSRRFVLGDRFHNTSKPHKSPLCLFHDIDLCMQSNTIKTSYQELENNRKNMKRLRSSTLQGFGLHFCFNYLMDFYQNEAIMKQQ